MGLTPRCVARVLLAAPDRTSCECEILSRPLSTVQHVFAGCIEEANRKDDMLLIWLQSNQSESDETSSFLSSLSGSLAAVVQTYNQREGDRKEEVWTVR
ncbi:hypothetical protein NC653_014884 [Populus alba x Populus x berolinensis]|uniref:Uncharacterized protein n=1 Tax=Populus alba x Populus x berolinensis TaxID=444605 RepID=A0AAD6QYJ3_9ROSI|nr:hypothetical protein NC653_014884 [Populus alba x Populus x berolinensis]